MNTAVAIYDRHTIPRIAFNLGLATGIGLVLGGGILIFPLISFALIIVGAAALYLLPRPFLSLQFLIFASIFTSTIPRGRLVPMLAPNELMLAASLGVSVFYVVAYGRGKSYPGAILFGGLVLIFGTAIVPIASYQLRGIGISFFAMFKMIAPAQYLILFWMYNTIPRTDEDRQKLIQLVFLCASIVSLLGLMQAAGIGPIRSFLLSWYPSDQAAGAADLGRITSVFGAWNVLGTFLMINLLLLASLQNETHRPIYQLNMFASAILSLFALLASGSYASLGGLIVGFTLIKIIDPRGLRLLMPLFVLMGIGFILLLPLISERFLFQFRGGPGGGIIPWTLAYRFKVWNEIYIPLISKSPWWGVSPTFDDLWFGFAESQYLFLLFRSGIVSVVAFFTWLGSILFWLFVIIRNEMSYMRMVAVTVFTALLIMIPMGLTNPVFTYSGVVDLLWILLGLIANSRKDKLHVAY